MKVKVKSCQVIWQQYCSKFTQVVIVRFSQLVRRIIVNLRKNVTLIVDFQHKTRSSKIAKFAVFVAPLVDFGNSYQDYGL